MKPCIHGGIAARLAPQLRRVCLLSARSGGGISGRRGKGSKGSECKCNELAAGGFYIGCVFVNFYAFTGSDSFWVGARENIESNSVVWFVLVAERHSGSISTTFTVAVR